jgi:hypothetical protein
MCSQGEAIPALPASTLQRRFAVQGGVNAPARQDSNSSAAQAALILQRRFMHPTRLQKLLSNSSKGANSQNFWSIYALCDMCRGGGQQCSVWIILLWLLLHGRFADVSGSKPSSDV